MLLFFFGFFLEFGFIQSFLSHLFLLSLNFSFSFCLLLLFFSPAFELLLPKIPFGVADTPLFGGPSFVIQPLIFRYTFSKVLGPC